MVAKRVPVPAPGLRMLVALVLLGSWTPAAFASEGTPAPDSAAVESAAGTVPLGDSTAVVAPAPAMNAQLVVGSRRVRLIGAARKSCPAPAQPRPGVRATLVPGVHKSGTGG